MDIDDIYGDLDNFHVEEVKNSELLALEAKYQESLTTIDQLKAENADLQKKVKTMQVNFQNLLDTAKAEIRRKDKQIAELRMEKDDLCFRRKQPKPARLGASGGTQQQGNFNLQATTLPTYNYDKTAVSVDQQEHNAWIPAKTDQQPLEVVPNAAAATEPAELSSRGRAVECTRSHERHTDRDKHSSRDSRGRRESSSSRHRSNNALERRRGNYESESSGSTYERNERKHREHEDLRKDSRHIQSDRVRSSRMAQEKYKNIYEERRSRNSSHAKRESGKHEQQSGKNDTVRENSVKSREPDNQAEADCTQIADSTRNKKEKCMPKNDEHQDTTRQEQHNRKRHERDKALQGKEQNIEDNLRRKSDNPSSEITKVIPKVDELQQHVKCATKCASLVDSKNENGVCESPSAGSAAEHVTAPEINAKVALSQTGENSNVTRALQQLHTPTKAALFNSLFGETPSSVESASSNLFTNVMNLLQCSGGSRHSTVTTSSSVCTDNEDKVAQKNCAVAKQLVDYDFVENAAPSEAKQKNSAVVLVGVSGLSDVASEYIPGLGYSPLCERTSLKRSSFGFLMNHNDVDIEDDSNIDVTGEERNNTSLMVAAENHVESRQLNGNGKADIVILEDIQLPHVFKFQESNANLLPIETSTKSNQQKDCDLKLKVASGDIENQQAKNNGERKQATDLHEVNKNLLNEGECLKPTISDEDATTLLNEIVPNFEASKIKDQLASKAELEASAQKECVENEAHISNKSGAIANRQAGISAFESTEIVETGRKVETSTPTELTKLEAEPEPVKENKENPINVNFKDAENMATADQVSEKGVADLVAPDNNKSTELDAENTKKALNMKTKVEQTLNAKHCTDDATVQLNSFTCDNNSLIEGAKDMTASAKLFRNDVDDKAAEFETATAELPVVSEKATKNFIAERETTKKGIHIESLNNEGDCNGHKDSELTASKDCLCEMAKTEESRHHVAEKISNMQPAHTAHSNFISTKCEITGEVLNCVETGTDRESTSDLQEVAVETQPQALVETSRENNVPEISHKSLEIAVTDNSVQSAKTGNVKESAPARKQTCHQRKVPKNANENGLETLITAAQLHENAKQLPPTVETEIADTLIQLKNSTPNGVKALEESAGKQENTTDGKVNNEENTNEKVAAQQGQDTFSSMDDAEIDAVSYIVHSVSYQALSSAYNSLEEDENATQPIETPKLTKRKQEKSELESTKCEIKMAAEKLEAKRIDKPDEGVGRRKKKAVPALVHRKLRFHTDERVQNAGKSLSGKGDKKKDKSDAKIEVEIIDLDKLDNEKCKTVEAADLKVNEPKEFEMKEESKSVKAADLKIDNGPNTLKEWKKEEATAGTVKEQRKGPATTFKPLSGQSDKARIVLPLINCLFKENNAGLQAINKFKIPKLAKKKVEPNVEVSSEAADKQIENPHAKRQMPRMKTHDAVVHTKVKTLKRTTAAETVQIPSELVETREKLELSAREVDKQIRLANNACEESNPKCVQVGNESTKPSLPEPTLELLEEQKALLKRKLSECCLDEDSDEELPPPKVARRLVKRRRRKMRLLDTDDEFVEESCSALLKPSVADNSENEMQQETKTTAKLEAQHQAIIEINATNLKQSQTAHVSNRVAEIQANPENAAIKETKAEVSQLTVLSSKQKIAAQIKPDLNMSFSSDNCNAPLPMSPANTSQDERYREIDSRLQSMFASPPRSGIALRFTPEAPTTPPALALDFNVSESLVADVSGISTQPADLTIDETNRLEQSGNNLETNSTLDDSTGSTSTKNISLGLSDYRFEKVSDNVVNLFIKRKRRGKKPPAQLEHNLTPTTAS